MKLKALKLLLFFLATGLFVSSKGTADNTTACSSNCQKQTVCPVRSNAAAKKNDGSYPFALAPGSYIFYY